ncbi:MAG: zinc-dependent peptidase [Bdellovibrio sp.]|nr:zinc-dependent peptidase [Bdellovibrio sp.]
MKTFIIVVGLLAASGSYAQMLSHFAAGVDDVQQAACKKKMPMNDAQILAWLANKTKNGKRIPQHIFGNYNFINENSELLQLFETLQSVSLSKSQFLSTDFSAPLKGFAASSCQDVTCALKELYGAKEGLRVLYILGEYDYNVSSAQSKSARPFTLAELDTLTMGLADIPTFLRHKKVNNPLYIVDAEGPYGNSTIQLFVGWSQIPTWQKNYVVYHEFSHNIAEVSRKTDQSKEWIQLSGWQPAQVKNTFDFFDPKNWIRPNTDSCLSGYACTNAAEYFAEAFTSYRYSPQRLLKTNPEVFATIKKLYQQNSYLNEDTCKANHPEYVQELPSVAALEKQLEDGINVLFKQNSQYDKELNQLCYDRVTGGKTYPFSQAKAIDMQSDDCMNKEILKALKIEDKNYSFNELILGLKPLDAVRKFAAKPN